MRIHGLHSTVCLLILFSGVAHATNAVEDHVTRQQQIQCNQIVNEAHKMPDDLQEQKFRSLLSVTRCVKCPNQSLESSQAGLANDLRMQICLKVLKNRTAEQIKDDLVRSYGDYILYDPKFRGNYALWLLPVILLVAGLLILFFNIRSRNPAVREKLSATDESRLDALLKDSPKDSNEERKQ